MLRLAPSGAAVVMVTAAMAVAVGDAARVVSGQTVCPAPDKPCYKMAYFGSVSSRVSFSEALQACDTDQGALLSIESEEEQRTIESLLQELRSGAGSDSGITDGDFWIGLTRTETSDPNQVQNQVQNQSQSCPGLYSWTDGSSASYRNWYEDEPSCGGEACVVLYHQPTALPGVGGAYLHQWNDDRCNMKHNFICKYHSNTVSVTRTEVARPKPTPEEKAPPQIQDTPSGLLLVYILLPTVPLMLMILLASGSCFCNRLHNNRSSRSKTPDQTNLWISQGQDAQA